MSKKEAVLSDVLKPGAVLSDVLKPGAVLSDNNYDAVLADQVLQNLQEWSKNIPDKQDNRVKNISKQFGGSNTEHSKGKK